MASCLGLYIESNVIKYAKVTKEREALKIESFGMKFYEKLGDAIKQIISETFSYKVPITVNLSEDMYNYFYMFSMLNKNDLKKAIETEFESYCYDKNVNNFVQAIYQQNPENLTSLFNNTDANSNFMHYYNIYKNFELDSISNITTNKCIINPLGNPISDIKTIRVDVSGINDWMLNELNKNPTDLYQLSSRSFEELVAEILTRKGYKVELTPATRDGGKDIYAARKDDLGSFLYIVECKKYKPTHKVGVNVLRDLYGVLSKERATYGIAVTTSYFSKPAQEFQQEIQFQMSLQDFNSIKQWLFDVTHT